MEIVIQEDDRDFHVRDVILLQSVVLPDPWCKTTAVRIGGNGVPKTTGYVIQLLSFANRLLDLNHPIQQDSS